MTIEIAIALGAICGALVVWLLLRASGSNREGEIRRQYEVELSQVRERSRGLEEERVELREEVVRHEGTIEELRSLLAAQREESAKTIAELRVRAEEERKQAAEIHREILQAKEALSNQFKSLAQEIFEEKSKTFTEQSKSSVGALLEPLKVKLQEFQGKVEEVYVNEGKDRSALKEQVRQLLELNQTLSQDAKNLTAALTGSVKTQGNWGELVLVRLLEAAGLREGHEYEVQVSRTQEDGSRLQPDVMIHLPESRHLIIDSKVSLTAYEQFSSSEDEETRALSLKRHIDSIRTHIRQLDLKSYQNLPGVRTLDFVLMFVPVEPAFMLAVSSDRELSEEAWNRNVLLVSPSTLLFVLKTVAHLWRQEAQTKNAQEIAKQGRVLYDKFCGFLGDLDKVGRSLEQASNSFGEARKKLAEGKGNLLRQAERLRELGVRPTKSLPESISVEFNEEEIVAEEDDSFVS